MKVATATPNIFFDSVAVSLAGYPRERAARRSPRALLELEDRTGRAFEIVLRVLLGSSLLLALGETCWQLTQH